MNPEAQLQKIGQTWIEGIAYIQEKKTLMINQQQQGGVREGDIKERLEWGERVQIEEIYSGIMRMLRRMLR